MATAVSATVKVPTEQRFRLYVYWGDAHRVERGAVSAPEPTTGASIASIRPVSHVHRSSVSMFCRGCAAHSSPSS